MLKKTTYILLFMSFIKNTYSQIDITFRNIEQAISVRDVWNINVNVQQNQVLYFQVTITSNKEGKIYEARSNTMQLVQGTYSLNNDMLQPLQQLFVLPDWNFKFKEDLYTIQMQAIAYPSNQVLSNYISNFTFSTRSSNVLSSTNIKKKVSFSFNGGLNGQYSDAFNNDFVFQPNYARFDVHPTLTLFEIPFTSDIFVTTEQKQSGNTINNFVFKFDYNQLKNNLIQKLLQETDKIIQNKVPEKYGFLKKMSVAQAPYYYKNAEAWTQEIQSPETWKQLQSLEKLEQYKQLINNPAIKSKLSAFDEYTSKLKIENTEELTNKLQELKSVNYDEILTWTKELHIDTIEKLKKIIAVASTAKNMQDADVLENLKSGDYKELYKLKTDLHIDTIEKLKKITAIVNAAENLQDTSLLNNLKNGDYSELYRLKKDMPSDSIQKLQKMLSGLNHITAVKDAAFTDEYKSLYKNYDSALLNKLNKAIENGVFKNIDSLQTKKGIDAQKYVTELKKYTGVSSIKEAEQLLDLDKQYNAIKENALTAVKNKKELTKIKQQYDKIKDINKIEVSKLISNESNFNALLKNITLTKQELFFKNVKRFELGTVFPEATTFGISGVVVKGYNVEYSSSKLYLSSFAGKADNFRLDTFKTSAVKYKKVVASVGVGYGNKSETHFHVHYIYTKEKGKNYYDSLTSVFYAPAQNHIIVSDIGGLLFRKNLFIGNEFGYSYYITATSRENNSNGTKSTINGFSQRTYLAGKIPVTNTKVNTSVQYVDVNYVSLNTPFILRDRLILESKIEQPFLKNKLLIAAQYRLDIDSISRDKLYRNNIHSLNTTIALNIPKYPYVQVTYIPIITKLSRAVYDNHPINYTGSLILNTGYNYSICKGKLNGSTQFTYSNSLFNMMQSFQVSAPEIAVNYLNYIYQNVHTYSLRQTFGLKKNTNVQFGINYVQPSHQDSLLYKTISTDLSISWVMLKKSTNTVGVNYSNGNNTNRIGFFIQSSFPITKYISIDIRIQKEQLNRRTAEYSGNIHGITLKTQLRFKI